MGPHASPAVQRDGFPPISIPLEVMFPCATNPIVNIQSRPGTHLVHSYHTYIFPSNSYLDLRDHLEVRHQARSICDNNVNDITNFAVDIHNNIYHEGNTLGT